MNNNNENKNLQDNAQETNKSPKSSFFAKRWTFPVIYLAASVLIVGLMYAKSQNAAPYDVKKTTETPKVAGPAVPSTDTDATAANAAPTFQWPVGEGGADAAVSMDFYRDDASEEDKAASIISYDNSFIANQGVNLGLKNDASFTVVSAAKGTVLSVSEDPLMGQTIEIQHEGGYTTYYASLTSVDVQKGAQVLAGQPIAKTGNNRLEKDEKNHLHFELRKDGKPVDPNTVLPKKPKLDNAKTTHTDSEQSAATTSTDAQEKASSTSTAPAEKKPDAATNSKMPAPATPAAPSAPAEKTE
ncbi:M23 family metallopeptidase [Tumebacillus permanentifrigoris]|uniref:Stage II sporulation protein Q n=1 Tax=Tumebacillus permanentifrigoris TaxID=378543 RepID=A0A316DDE1_9BACL|nr:M23 family metallopeptidase [Tumebacillus permanentifrigoris]PWK16247.1 stage II sporulation protein Q [Tumebacillus permanentifrigoris]